MKSCYVTLCSPSFIAHSPETASHPNRFSLLNLLVRAAAVLEHSLFVARRQEQVRRLKHPRNLEVPLLGWLAVPERIAEVMIAYNPVVGETED